MAEEWNADAYDRVADPQTRWGLAVLQRLPLDGAERVMDAGCGTGRVTEALLAELPRGRLIALDGSRRMLAEASRRLGRRAELLCADLGAPLPLASASLDAVFSTATFHWVLDHDLLFAEIARALRPGGRLVAQCGGAGNIAHVIAAARVVGDGWDDPKHFAAPEEARARLGAAGFTDVHVWLEEAPTPFPPGDPLETFLATVCLRRHLERLPERKRAGFVRAVAERLPRPEIDYVRLNVDARRAG